MTWQLYYTTVHNLYFQNETNEKVPAYTSTESPPQKKREEEEDEEDV